MPAVDTEAVLRFIKIRGPVLPVQIAKEINHNLMMAGAVLSEMVSSGKLRVSKLKIGGSPLYYSVGQENRLTGFTQHLGSKERTTFETLKTLGVIQDSATDALTRVTLRAIKDFAIPLTVTMNGKQEIFWKYFMISDSEAESKIKFLLGLEEKKPESHTGDIAGSGQIDPVQTSQSFEPRPMPQLKPQKPQVSGDEYDDEKPAKTQQATIFEATAQKRNEIIEAAKKPETEAEKKPETITDKEIKRENQENKEQKNKSRKSKTTQSPTDLPTSAQQTSPIQEFMDDCFFKNISTFFAIHSITVLSAECHRKGSDYDLAIKLASPVGEIKMHCMALNKKTVADFDVTEAFARSQMHHLPGLLLATGEPTKKAQALLNTKLQGLTLKKI